MRDQKESNGTTLYSVSAAWHNGKPCSMGFASERRASCFCVPLPILYRGIATFLVVDIVAPMLIHYVPIIWLERPAPSISWHRFPPDTYVKRSST